MNRCKCIVSFTSPKEGISFSEGEFYFFDYVPPMGDRLPFYKVFQNGKNQHVDLDIKSFDGYFKKYS